MSNFDENPAKAQLRREKLNDRLSENPGCSCCGHSAPEALVSVRLAWLEKHHVVGKANDPEFPVEICRNCHAVVTARALDVGASMNPPDTVLDLFVAIMRGLGSFLKFAGEKMLEWADTAVRLIAGLDKACPTWRQLPEAK